jgi:hypothetical protein
MLAIYAPVIIHKVKTVTKGNNLQVIKINEVKLKWYKQKQEKIPFS